MPQEQIVRYLASFDRYQVKWEFYLLVRGDVGLLVQFNSANTRTNDDFGGLYAREVEEIKEALVKEQGTTPTKEMVACGKYCTERKGEYGVDKSFEDLSKEEVAALEKLVQDAIPELLEERGRMRHNTWCNKTAEKLVSELRLADAKLFCEAVGISYGETLARHGIKRTY